MRPRVATMGRAIRDRRAGLIGPAVLALALYPPLVVTKRGEVAADSKQLLFVNAGRFLGKVPYLWDPSVGMGTVTHQTLGYLLPMGPWFWVTDQLDSVAGVLVALSSAWRPNLAVVACIVALALLLHPLVAALMVMLRLKDRIG